MTRIHLARAEHRFACAHMTVFPDGSKERLHGHNYTVGLTLELREASFATMIEFARFREILAGLCGELRERVLVAERNPHHEWVRRDGRELEFRLCGQRYVLPADDVRVLPIDNASVEALAGYLAGRVAEALRETPGLSALELTVEEAPGQGATSRLSLQ
jgi:6-pyruvoyltetrahydropterin/6-carboxytetrahydropterin synthase